MGLRSDFFVHKKRTVESFRHVGVDISSINTSIDSIRNFLTINESKVSVLDAKIPSLQKTMDKLSVDIDMEHNYARNIKSEIDLINRSFDSFRDKISSGLKTESLKNKRLNSSFKKTQKDVKKNKNFLNKKLLAIKKKNIGLEKMLKNHRKTILALNRKIESKKIKKKSVKGANKIKPKIKTTKKVTPEKVITQIITPTTKTLTEIKK